jgi:hypothetical protein
MTRRQITNSNNTQDLRGKTLTVCQGNIHGARYRYLLLFKAYNTTLHFLGFKDIYESLNRYIVTRTSTRYTNFHQFRKPTFTKVNLVLHFLLINCCHNFNKDGAK